MTIRLARAESERELLDPEMVGEWADELADLCRVRAEGPWGVHVARDRGEPVGIGLFKGPPDEQGWVELAYLTFVPCRGRGIATGIARELVRIAADEKMAGIRAHTLPEENASTAVLQRNGFVCRGIVTDPADGDVWRWERLC
ncbi:GNAT family N-acetyltransferase [Sphingomonas sp.]|uniref:GNAT family N-acetyltransferase n=1 Tax=Sphingomonas sp. TaxID=28214 RepID=UPI0038AA4F9F